MQPIYIKVSNSYITLSNSNNIPVGGGAEQYSDQAHLF